MVRCKFRVSKYETSLNNNEELRTVHLSVVYNESPENKEFFKWTPSGTIQIGMLNQKAWEQFPLGREIYVDFTDATPVSAQKPPVVDPASESFKRG
jgi:hypothetical protein